MQNDWIFCTNVPYEPRPKLHDKNLLAVLGQSRPSRCVRCYEDRYYENRARTASYGRFADDRGTNNWYYPAPERGEDRYRDYERYDRYTPRGYERGYEGRDYDRGYDYDRYDNRRGSYDRLGYGSAPTGTERYYDRTAARPLDYGYERDYNDRYNARYDYRNYRPSDETYRGQSGYDDSERGYYYPNDDDRSYLPESGGRYAPEEDRRYLPEKNDRRYPPQDDRRYPPQDDRSYLPKPCDPRISNCGYDSSRRPSTGAETQVSTGPINSNNASPNNKGSSVINKEDDSKNDAMGNSMRGNENQDRDRQQSSTYGGRSARPLGGSYLFDREDNAIVKEDEMEGRANNMGTNETSIDGTSNK